MKRHRILVRRGVTYTSIPLQDVAYFYSENKLTFLRDMQGVKYLCDQTLTDLENELDAQQFFRINRQYICRIPAIKSFRTFNKGRLVVSLEPTAEGEIFVSQENANRFKKWMDGIYDSSIGIIK
ncbi:MAG: LytTR family transcriptional regulator DNA-binding domain-containing protein [Bacteroidetes bacterium]|nr:LytTR family transcriptional regulator DNA-binding domain-containing protein [Bacteroidota bacterium]